MVDSENGGAPSSGAGSQKPGQASGKVLIASAAARKSSGSVPPLLVRQAPARRPFSSLPRQTLQRPATAGSVRPTAMGRTLRLF